MVLAPATSRALKAESAKVIQESRKLRQAAQETARRARVIHAQAVWHRLLLRITKR